MLPGEATTFTSIDRCSEQEDSFGTDLPTTVFNKQLPSGMPPHKLYLKPGCVVICLRNLNVTAGVCNGTRLRVDEIKDEVGRILFSRVAGSLLHAVDHAASRDQVHLHEDRTGAGGQDRGPFTRLRQDSIPATPRLLPDGEQGTRADLGKGFLHIKN